MRCPPQKGSPGQNGLGELSHLARSPLEGGLPPGTGETGAKETGLERALGLRTDGEVQ